MLMPDLAFYDKAAEVLPVLYLALVFESRIFRRRRSGRSAEAKQRQGRWRIEVAVVAIVVFLLLGEVVALRVLATREASELQRQLVGAALAMAFGLLAYRTVADVLWERRRELSGWTREHRQRIAAASLLVVLLGSYLALATT
jgi:hypothetical protein